MCTSYMQSDAVTTDLQSESWQIRSHNTVQFSQVDTLKKELDKSATINL